MANSNLPERILSNFDSSKCELTNSIEKILESKMQGALLPDCIPFALDEAYRTNFSGDDFIPLPASYRLAYWQKHICTPAWEKAVEGVNAINEKLRCEYDKQLAAIKASNERTRLANCKQQEDFISAQEEYRVGQARYAEAKIEYAACLDAQGTARLEYHKARSVRRLREAVEFQGTHVEAALKHARQLAEYKVATSEPARMLKYFIFAAIVSLPWMLVSSILCLFAYMMRIQLEMNLREEFANELTNYNVGRHKDAALAKHAFWTYGSKSDLDGRGSVHTPVHFSQVKRGGIKSPEDWFREEQPFGNVTAADLGYGFSFSTTLELLCSAVPVVGLVVVLVAVARPLWFDAIDSKREALNPSQINKKRYRKLRALLTEELSVPEVQAYLRQLDVPCRVPLPPLPGTPEAPTAPQQPTPQQFLSLPAPPKLRTAVALKPPASCFDTDAPGDFHHILKGAVMHGLEHVGRLAKYQLFADDCVRPFFVFGGVPFAFSNDSSPHFLVAGTSGSGKSTTMRHLMSQLLPLSRTQAARIAERSASLEDRRPHTAHEWSRSFTHQAIVYNAKGEYLDELRKFGFDQDRDLYNLDPADPSCYAWDIAEDVDDRDSIQRLAEELIPQDVGAKQDKNLETWLRAARGLVEAVIVSFRNASQRKGRKPSWNLRDLIRACGTEDALRHVLYWHDMPLEQIDRYFNIADGQKSSVFLMVRESLGKFSLVANRWNDAQRRGRVISLKKWAVEGARSVLLLPNTMDNITTYGPLNQTLMKALTGIILNPEYTLYRDETGEERARKRFFFADEVGQAGQLDELERLLSEGRSFGVNAILGVHQLSHLVQVYGQEKADSIIGLCSYLAFLKSTDVKTTKWMSEFIGNCLRTYEKESYAYGTSNGKAYTQTTNVTRGTTVGTSRSHTAGTSEGTSDTYGESSSSTSSESTSKTTSNQPSGPHGTDWHTSRTTSSGTTETSGTSSSHTTTQSNNTSDTVGTSSQESESESSGKSYAKNESSSKTRTESIEIRGEATIEPHEFRQFPDLASTGRCKGIYGAPTLPMWQVELDANTLRPEYEFPEKCREERRKRTPEEDERVSRSVAWDQSDMARLQMDEIPHISGAPELPSTPKLLTQQDISEPRPSKEKPSEQPPEESTSDEPPPASFDW